MHCKHHHSQSRYAFHSGPNLMPSFCKINWLPSLYIVSSHTVHLHADSEPNQASIGVPCCQIAMQHASQCLVG